MNKTKKEILLFLTILLILSGISYAFIFQSENPNVEDSSIALLLVYCPFFAAIISRLIIGHNIKDMGWRFGKGRYLLISLLIPILAGGIVYGSAWLTKLGYINENAELGLDSGLPRNLDFILFCAIGLLTRSIGAFGEEVGWRGFLTPRLYKLTNISMTSIIIGIIWFVWHIPLLLMTSYGSDLTILKVIFSTVGLIAISFILSWLRIKSGSLWVGVFYHASHNFFVQGIFDQAILEKGGNSFLLTEMGLGLCVTSIIIAIVFWVLRKKIPQPESYKID